MKAYMVSACLLGVACRYDGKSKPNSTMIKLFAENKVYPFCPELLANLGIPRRKLKLTGTGQEILDGKATAVSEDGTDCSPQLIEGAKRTLAFAKIIKPDLIYLKSKSPSCGVKTNGIMGVTTALLKQNLFKIEEAG